MKTEMTFTNQIIKFENGKKFAIYSKLTKKGIRFYYFSKMQFRFFPISEFDLNKYICLED